MPITVPSLEEGAALGAALLAVKGCDVALYDEICRKTDGVRCVIKPVPELTARYERQYQNWREFYPALRSVFAANQANSNTK